MLACFFSTAVALWLQKTKPMAARIPTVLLLMTVFIYGCTEADNPKKKIEEEVEADTIVLVDSTFQYCDSVTVATSVGTSCCVSGKTVAKPNDIFRYQYQMNHRDATVKWVVLEGDISIIAGQDTRTVIVAFGPDFTTGIIQGRGTGLDKDDIPLFCEDRVIISKE
jgi:hypothetical protein